MQRRWSREPRCLRCSGMGKLASAVAAAGHEPRRQYDLPVRARIRPLPLIARDLLPSFGRRSRRQRQSLARRAAQEQLRARGTGNGGLWAREEVERGGGSGGCGQCCAPCEDKGWCWEEAVAGPSVSVFFYGYSYCTMVAHLLLRRGRRLNREDDRDPLLYTLAAIQRLHFQSVPQQLQILVCTGAVRVRSRWVRRYRQEPLGEVRESNLIGSTAGSSEMTSAIVRQRGGGGSGEGRAGMRWRRERGRCYEGSGARICAEGASEFLLPAADGHLMYSMRTDSVPGG